MTGDPRARQPAPGLVRATRGALRAGVGLLLLAVLLLAAAMLVAPLLGYQRYVVTGGSMEGTIDRGSLVYAKQVPVESLGAGDVITYDPPVGAAPRGNVTHRIVWMGTDEHGNRAFRTRGDANPAPDPWKFVLDKPTQARVAWHLPYAGYGFAALDLRWARMLLLGLPALLVGAHMLVRLWRESGEQLRRQAAETA